MSFLALALSVLDTSGLQYTVSPIINKCYSCGSVVSEPQSLCGGCVGDPTWFMENDGADENRRECAESLS